MKKRLSLVLFFFSLIVGITLFGGTENLFDLFKEKQVFLQVFCRENLFLSILLYLSVFIFTATLCLPFMSLLIFVAGALFSLKLALLLSSFGLSLGACGAFMMSRYWMGGLIERKFGARLQAFHDNFEKHGDYYLMSLRLSPLIPFWMINLFMGLTRMKLWKFYFLTQLGTFVFVFLIVNAGAQLSALENLSDLLSLKVWLSLFLLGGVPLLFRYFMIKKSRS